MIVSRALAWLEEERAPRFVALLRIALCGFLLFERFWSLGGTLRVHAARPMIMDAPLVDALGLPWPPPTWLPDALTIAIPVVGLLACIGLFTRAALAALFLLWLYPGAVQAGWGFFNHTPALAIQLVFVLTLVPGTTAYSVDRLIAARRQRAPVQWAPPAARWGELLALSVIGAFYFTAGVSKLRYGAESFLDGTSLAYYLGGQASRQLWFGPLDPSPALLWKDGFQIDGYVYISVDRAISKAIAARQWLCAVLSWLAVAFELLAWPALLAPARVRGPAILILQAFHIGMNLLIGPAFYVWQIALACALPFSEIGAWWRARRAQRAPGAP